MTLLKLEKEEVMTINKNKNYEIIDFSFLEKITGVKSEFLPYMFQVEDTFKIQSFKYKVKAMLKNKLICEVEKNN